MNHLFELVHDTELAQFQLKIKIQNFKEDSLIRKKHSKKRDQNKMEFVELHGET